MATRLGKLLRKIRIDRDEYMKNMAERLGITSAYLSAIENGKRNMGNALLEKLAEVYSLPDNPKTKLRLEWHPLLRISRTWPGLLLESLMI